MQGYKLRKLSELYHLLHTLKADKMFIYTYDKISEITDILNSEREEPFDQIKTILNPFIESMGKYHTDDSNHQIYYQNQKMNAIDIDAYKKPINSALKLIKYHLYSENRPSSAESTNRGGAGSIKYNGRTYKIHTGKRGGKYILVGTDKKKVYV